MRSEGAEAFGRAQPAVPADPLPVSGMLEIGTGVTAVTGWFLHQPLWLKALVTLAALAAAYVLLVLLRLLVAVLYGAFRGLG